MTMTAGSGMDTDAIVMRLSHRHGVAETVVRMYVDEASELFANARIKAFVPLLIEREACRMLRAFSSAWDDDLASIEAKKPSSARVKEPDMPLRPARVARR
jgi:hypothetical protein